MKHNLGLVEEDERVVRKGIQAPQVKQHAGLGVERHGGVDAVQFSV